MHIHMRSCGVEKYPVPVAVVGIMDHAAEAVSRSPVAVCALCRRTGTACTSTRGSGSARRTGALHTTPACGVHALTPNRTNLLLVSNFPIVHADPDALGVSIFY